MFLTFCIIIILPKDIRRFISSLHSYFILCIIVIILLLLLFDFLPFFSNLFLQCFYLFFLIFKFIGFFFLPSNFFLNQLDILFYLELFRCILLDFLLDVREELILANFISCWTSKVCDLEINFVIWCWVHQFFLIQKWGKIHVRCHFFVSCIIC